MKCIKCQTEYEGKFCPECGTPAEIICPKCNTAITGKFCTNCGYSAIKTQQPTEPTTKPQAGHLDRSEFKLRPEVPYTETTLSQPSPVNKSDFKLRPEPPYTPPPTNPIPMYQPPTTQPPLYKQAQLKHVSNKRKWITLAIILLGLFAVFLVIGYLSEKADNETDTTTGTVSSAVSKGDVSEELDEITNDPPKESSTVPQKEIPSSQSNATMGQKNALSKAKSYLDIIPFSFNGLVTQLEFDKFTNEEAVYGASNCGADWKEQAVKKAKSYTEIMSFSREGLIEQLEFDGFTHDEAVYGTDQNGY